MTLSFSQSSVEIGSAAALILAANLSTVRHPHSELVMPFPAIAHFRASSGVVMPLEFVPVRELRPMRPPSPPPRLGDHDGIAVCGGCRSAGCAAARRELRPVWHKVIPQHSLQQRHISQHADAAGLAVGHNINFDCPREQAVRQFIDHDGGAGRERFVQLGPAKIAHPNVADFSRALQTHQRGKRFAHRRRRHRFGGKMPDGTA